MGISKTSRARGAAEELRAAELRSSFFPAPKGPGSITPSCLLCLAAGFGRRVLGTGLSPCAEHQVGNGHRVQRRWEGAGAGRGELELAEKAARTQFISVSCFVSTPPLKSCLDLISLTRKVQVHPGELSPSLSQPPSAAAKLPAGIITLPKPASLPCWHSLTPASLQPFSPD